jgi:hypothetical protein
MTARQNLFLFTMQLSRHFQRFHGLRDALQLAFAVTRTEEPLTPEDVNLLDRIAGAVVARKMAGPALLFLESVGPMNFLGSQALHVLSPILNLACDTPEIERAAQLLERRDAIPRLIALIEAKSAAGLPTP